MPWPCARADTALSSDLQLPVLERRNPQCVSDLLEGDVLGRSCDDYAKAPSDLCSNADVREKCCACGGGNLVPDSYEICEIARTSLSRAIVVCAGKTKVTVLI